MSTLSEESAPKSISISLWNTSDPRPDKSAAELQEYTISRVNLYFLVN